MKQRDKEWPLISNSKKAGENPYIGGMQAVGMNQISRNFNKYSTNENALKFDTQKKSHLAYKDTIRSGKSLETQINIIKALKDPFREQHSPTFHLPLKDTQSDLLSNSLTGEEKDTVNTQQVQLFDNSLFDLKQQETFLLEQSNLKASDCIDNRNQSAGSFEMTINEINDPLKHFRETQRSQKEKLSSQPAGNIKHFRQKIENLKLNEEPSLIGKTRNQVKKYNHKNNNMSTSNYDLDVQNQESLNIYEEWKQNQNLQVVPQKAQFNQSLNSQFFKNVPVQASDTLIMNQLQVPKCYNKSLQEFYSHPKA